MASKQHENIKYRYLNLKNEMKVIESKENQTKN